MRHTKLIAQLILGPVVCPDLRDLSWYQRGPGLKNGSGSIRTGMNWASGRLSFCSLSQKIPEQSRKKKSTDSSGIALGQRGLKETVRLPKICIFNAFTCT